MAPRFPCLRTKLRPRHGLLLATAVLTLALAACTDPYGRTFDTIAWRNADFDTTSVRSEMLADLTRGDRLIGLTRADVTALLGPPTPSEKFRQWQMVYVTGPLGLDFEWLLLRLGAGGRVAEYAIRSD